MTIAVVLAAWSVEGISVDGTSASIGAALLLGIFNAFARPILLLLSAPLILVSLAVFLLVLNALVLMLVPTFVPGFHVARFGSAVWGAIIIGFISWLSSAFFRGSDGRVHILTHHGQVARPRGSVIESNQETRA
jgi:putative membrane protein